MSDCAHEKVYSGEHFWTLKPRWRWICANCYEKGSESLWEHEVTSDMDRYIAILEKCDPDGAASMKHIQKTIATRKVRMT